MSDPLLAFARRVAPEEDVDSASDARDAIERAAEERSDDWWSELASLFDAADERDPRARAVLVELSSGRPAVPDDELLARLDAEEDRPTAIRYCEWRAKADPRSLVPMRERIVSCLGASDPHVRERAARTLDFGRDRLGSPEVVEPLLERTDDSRPRTRASAVATLVWLGIDFEASVGRTNAAIVDAAAAALEDDAPEVRVRASLAVDEMAEFLPSMEADADARRHLVAALTDALDDDHPRVADRAAAALLRVVSEFPEDARPVIDDLIRRGWEADDRGDGTARKVVSTVAESIPEAVADEALDLVVSGAESAETPLYEARTLGAVAADAPDVVVAAVPALVDALGSPSGENRRAAAKALVAIARERPDAVPEPVDALVEAIDDGDIDVASDWEPVVTLAAADPAFAADRLADLFAGVDPDDSGMEAYYAASLANRLGTDHPAVVAGSVDALAGMFPYGSRSVRQEAAEAIADVAAHDPTAVAPWTESLAAYLADVPAETRAAVARALCHVATERPEAIPPLAEPLCDAAPPVESADTQSWPLGVVARSSPAFAQWALAFALSKLETTVPVAREVGGLLAEVAAADPEVAAPAVDRVVGLLSAESAWSRLCAAEALAECASELPELAASGTELLADLVVDPDEDWKTVTAAAGALESIASASAETVRSALRARIDDAAAFVEESSPSTSSDRESLLGAVGLDDEPDGGDRRTGDDDDDHGGFDSSFDVFS